MSSEGWIRIWRKLQDDRIWTTEPFTRGQAWVDLILLANHEDGFFRVRGVRVEIKRGQVGWSEVSLSKRWKWSRGKVRRFFFEIEKNDLKIVQQKNNVCTLITIINYDTYQTNGTANGTTDGQQTVQQTDTNKNDKNVKNVKKEKDICAFDFETFWVAYPKKRSKGQAEKTWLKIKPDKDLLQKILSAIENAKESHDWKKDGGKFVPYPATWLNAKGWEDHYEIEILDDQGSGISESALKAIADYERNRKLGNKQKSNRKT